MLRFSKQIFVRSTKLLSDPTKIFFEKCSTGLAHLSDSQPTRFQSINQSFFSHPLLELNSMAGCHGQKLLASTQWAGCLLEGAHTPGFRFPISQGQNRNNGTCCDSTHQVSHFPFPLSHFRNTKNRNKFDFWQIGKRKLGVSAPDETLVIRSLLPGSVQRF